MSGAAQCAQIRSELGVYVLGAIEPGERRRVDEHLASSARCRDELAGLAALPGLLRKIPAESAIWAWTGDGADRLPGAALDTLIGRVNYRRQRAGLVSRVGAVPGRQPASFAVTAGGKTLVRSPPGKPQLTLRGGR